MKKTLILGMGNPILSDDAVGLLLARELHGKIGGTDTACSAMVGMDLLELLDGYETVFILDAMTTPGGSAGEWCRVSENDHAGTRHLFSSHGHNIFQLMELGRRCGLRMPRIGGVYGVEIGDEVAFGEDLSPELCSKFPAIADGIAGDILCRLKERP
ncbi:MAG TPA: hydrogenase maturation protease [Thermodesulfobacteriota bacterium]|nr:hydrogenase maturation protease [Thermodesulfobacteriota bacterium]